MRAKRRLKRLTLTTCALVFTGGIHADGIPGDDLTSSAESGVDPNQPARASVNIATKEVKRDYIEEVYVEGQAIDPARLDLIDFERIYDIKDKAARDFKLGRYEAAFPHLLMLAKQGFKDAQARVGYIYLHGLGGQQKSNLKALGWLGVASTGTTRPQYRNIFNELMDKVPESQFQNVVATVDDYRGKYDSDKKGVTCLNSSIQHIRKLTCRYDAEFDRHQDYLMLLAAAFELPW